MELKELTDIVQAGLVASFNPERRYIIVLDHALVRGTITSQLAKDLRKWGVKAHVLVADLQEGRTPPLQVFEMRADVQ